MDKNMEIIQKINRTIKNDGIFELFPKTINYISYKIKKSIDSKSPKAKDILFINGCTLPHPERYRVDHQIEQLEFNGLTCDKILYTDLTLEQLKYYRGFIFFRCPITDTIKDFIAKAHYFNKTTFFDIDDLVINKKYTDNISYVQQMSKEERELYDDGVCRMESTLKLCDYLITTTSALSRELSTYGKEVFINKNVASEKMRLLSEEAIKNKKENKNTINIGYLSGSITHNPDFQLISSSLIRIMKEYPNVHLTLMGYLDLPAELKPFEDRIERKKFSRWTDLPNIISSLDINLAPIEESIFNEAKSENKWTEASLCQVLTIASDYGAFKEAIEDKKTGLLCKTKEDWYNALKFAIENRVEARKIAENANKIIKEKYLSAYSGYPLTHFIESKLKKNINFILPSTNISGGVNVVLKHCDILRKNGYDVSVIDLAGTSKNIENQDGEINVLDGIHIKYESCIDTAVATLFSTLKFFNKQVFIKNKLYLVQNFETDFSNDNIYVRKEANSSYNSKNVKYITISKWCKKWLKEKYNKSSKYAGNGIDISKFNCKERKFKGKTKILIEGNSDDYYKNVDEAFKITNKLDRNKYEVSYLSYQGKGKSWYKYDNFYHQIPHDEIGKIYENHDILLKTSLLESFSYPPLEMMATGGYCVVAPNEGNIEYLENEKNCLFYEQGNTDDAIAQIERIVSDAKLRSILFQNSKKTVSSRDWQNLEKDILALYE